MNILILLIFFKLISTNEQKTNTEVKNLEDDITNKDDDYLNFLEKEFKDNKNVLKGVEKLIYIFKLKIEYAKIRKLQADKMNNLFYENVTIQDQEAKAKAQTELIYQEAKARALIEFTGIDEIFQNINDNFYMEKDSNSILQEHYLEYRRALILKNSENIESKKEKPLLVKDKVKKNNPNILMIMSFRIMGAILFFSFMYLTLFSNSVYFFNKTKKHKVITFSVSYFVLIIILFSSCYFI